MNGGMKVVGICWEKGIVFIAPGLCPGAYTTEAPSQLKKAEPFVYAFPGRAWERK